MQIFGNDVRETEKLSCRNMMWEREEGKKCRDETTWDVVTQVDRQIDDQQEGRNAGGGGEGDSGYFGRHLCPYVSRYG